VFLKDKGTKIFLDFGMQMSKVNQYFTEFLNPRTCNGMGDLFAFELLPKLKGLSLALSADNNYSELDCSVCKSQKSLHIYDTMDNFYK
jgi:hypothetical protein